MVFCAFNGGLIVSMTVLTIINTLMFDSLENRTFTVTSKVIQKRVIKDKSAKIIINLLKMYIKKEKGCIPKSSELLDLNRRNKEFMSLHQ